MENSGSLRRFPLAGIAAAAASVVCFRTGFGSFFFLLPLALLAFSAEAKSAWAAGIMGTAFNTIVSLWFYMYRGADLDFARWSALYYAIMALAFTWINAPLGRFWIHLDAPYRMAFAALCCTLVMAPVFLTMTEDPRLRLAIVRQLQALGGFSESPGVEGPTADELFAAMIRMGLRGGILVSCLVFWWINRQLGLGIIRISRRGNGKLPVSILAFHAAPFLIWIFSLSLGAVLLGKTAGLEMLEIGGWNILVLSGTLFLVQGGAVALFYLLKVPPLIRIIVNLGIIILIFKPGVNAALLGMLLLLGIAENWVPFRVPRDEPPPTPEA
ncbi:hypothetical protein AGMMS50230_15150 [Spirochaetia bacterium]|nr:hypothetical protein AGMMS50230_15150 [Spirochaetia bacterium]